MDPFALLGLSLVAWLLARHGFMLRDAARTSLPAHRSKRLAIGRRCFFASGALGFVVVVAGGGRASAYLWPERYLDDAARTGAPLIDALDRFVSARGKPPESLEELVPEFIAHIPPTECGPYTAWSYLGPPWVMNDDPKAWRLSVDLSTFLLRGSDARLQYASWDRRWLCLS